MNDLNFWVSRSQSSKSCIPIEGLILKEREIQSIEVSKLQTLLYDFTIFSLYEREYCQNKPTPLLSVAGLWCVKIALTRLTTKRLKFFNFTFLDLEIRHHPSGQPQILLRGNLARWYEKQNLVVETAITHQKTIAAATVVCFCRTTKFLQIE